MSNASAACSSLIRRTSLRRNLGRGCTEGLTVMVDVRLSVEWSVIGLYNLRIRVYLTPSYISILHSWEL